MKYLFPFLLVLIFPMIRRLQQPEDILEKCPPEQLRIRSEVVLSCGTGRHLAPMERLSLGLSVPANELTESDWHTLIGKKATSRLMKQSREQGFICRYRIAELMTILPRQFMDRLPPNLVCPSAPGKKHEPF